MILVCPVDDRGAVSGDSRDLPEQEAHDLVMAGRATLHRRQSEPPWVFLAEARRALQLLDRVGLPATPDVLKRVSEFLLPSNVRQTTLNGTHVGWEHSSSRGDLAFRKALIGPTGPAAALSRQIGEVLSFRLARKKPVMLDHEPTSEEIDALGILEVPGREDAEWAGEWRCYAIGSDWLAFRKECLAVSAALDEALEVAIREGRVLIVEELFPGGRLLHPDRWKNERYDPTDYANDWFLLTRDLPEEWFEARPKKPVKSGRPKGRGGYGKADAPFVDLIVERLNEGGEVTVHGVVTEIVARHHRDIPGASHEAKIRRLMKRIEDLHD